MDTPNLKTTAENSISREDYKNLVSSSPKMSTLNSLLLCEDAKVEIWTFLGIDVAVDFPSFPQDLIYGMLSEGIHLPALKEIFVPSSVSRELGLFYQMIAVRAKVPVVSYSVVEAYEGEQTYLRRGQGH